MKLNKKETIRLHRELWDWLYKHPSKDKEDWPEWARNYGYSSVRNLCFLCDYKGICCPVSWVKTDTCQGKGSYYFSWSSAKTLKTRKKYAKLIRDLPENKEMI